MVGYAYPSSTALVAALAIITHATPIYATPLSAPNVHANAPEASRTRDDGDRRLALDLEARALSMKHVMGSAAMAAALQPVINYFVNPPKKEEPKKEEPKKEQAQQQKRDVVDEAEDPLFPRSFPGNSEDGSESLERRLDWKSAGKYYGPGLLGAALTPVFTHVLNHMAGRSLNDETSGEDMREIVARALESLQELENVGHLEARTTPPRMGMSAKTKDRLMTWGPAAIGGLVYPVASLIMDKVRAGQDSKEKRDLNEMFARMLVEGGLDSLD
ncbi:hypothetical protein EYR40_008494 [Pleurotus pulmonarius]|nr:hypothetical protein EYR36_009312 [Pleurotus pulmonarius]KAF4592811.1 hypothetical protein EYR38_008513 [Pleurotus pulmonarius]KAF4593704.1 hypothetical protein EYR40_008494 [Pleurotus pulmonarius]